MSERRFYRVHYWGVRNTQTGKMKMVRKFNEDAKQYQWWKWLTDAEVSEHYSMDCDVEKADMKELYKEVDESRRFRRQSGVITSDDILDVMLTLDKLVANQETAER